MLHFYSTAKTPEKRKTASWQGCCSINFHHHLCELNFNFLRAGHRATSVGKNGPTLRGPHWFIGATLARSNQIRVGGKRNLVVVKNTAVKRFNVGQFISRENMLVELIFLFVLILWGIVKGFVFFFCGAWLIEN